MLWLTDQLSACLPACLLLACVLDGFALQRVKLYFIGLHSATPHEVDMARIYSFDTEQKMMVAHTPRVLGADNHEDMLEPVMRIR